MHNDKFPPPPTDLKSAHRGFYVDIGPAVGDADKIWTVSLNTESKRTPLVLIHGMGAGVAFWVLNLDALARHRPVYAIDILGFGRSSRPLFSNNAHEAERQMVKSIEEWRREMNIPQMILLGHSLGGFLSTSYAMQHPDRVKHLILADPWGFQEKPDKIKAPLWARSIATVLSPMNPLFMMRAAGPYGQWVVEKTRPDLIRKFAEHIDFVATEEPNVMAQYIHLCNAQTPSGESAFHAMMVGLGWAKNPMLLRMDRLRADVPLTLVYGSRSWISQTSWDLLKQSRASVHVQAINGAGHQIFVDKPTVFNAYVNAACAETDEQLEAGSGPTAAELGIDLAIFANEASATETATPTADVNDEQSGGEWVFFFFAIVLRKMFIQ